MKEKNVLGFTLVEILVVVSIISFLVSTAVYLFNDTRIRGRDSKRLADMKIIQNALEMYYDDNQKYPPLENARSWWRNGGCGSNSNTIGGLTAWCKANPSLGNYLAPYLSKMPVDPINKYYFYDSNPGDNYQTYALVSYLEHPKNIVAFANNTKDKGYDNGLYEIGGQPWYCKSHYSGINGSWVTTTSGTVCVGGN